MTPLSMMSCCPSLRYLDGSIVYHLLVIAHLNSTDVAFCEYFQVTGYDLEQAVGLYFIQNGEDGAANRGNAGSGHQTSTQQARCMQLDASSSLSLSLSAHYIISLKAKNHEVLNC